MKILVLNGSFTAFDKQNQSEEKLDELKNFGKSLR